MLFRFVRAEATRGIQDCYYESAGVISFGKYERVCRVSVAARKKVMKESPPDRPQWDQMSAVPGLEIVLARFREAFPSLSLETLRKVLRMPPLMEQDLLRVGQTEGGGSPNANKRCAMS
jgi:hypothetical protein